MQQRDYLMRQFEQLGIVLAALMGFRAKGEYLKGIEIINEAYDEIPGFDPELLHLEDPGEFLTKVLELKQNSYEKLNLIGNFLFEEAEFLILSGDGEKAADRYRKSLCLLEYLDRNEKIFSMERNQKIIRIRKMLG